MSDTKKCAHELCTCTVTDGKKFCSQICEDSVGLQTLKCDCKHPFCGGEAL